jgi:hypothetical protein
VTIQPVAKFVLLYAFLMLKTCVLQKSIPNYVHVVYSRNETSEGTVRQWCGMFKDVSKQMFMMKSGQPSVASDDLVQGGEMFKDA